MDDIEQRTLPVTAGDGVGSRLQLWVPPKPRTRLLFHGGLGIEGGYYEPFAQALAQAGHAVALLEPRGLGSSSVRPSRRLDFGYRELIEHDLPAAVTTVRDQVNGGPLLIGGHSLGAQLCTLAQPVLPTQVAGLVFVAAGTVWHRNWSGSFGRRIRVAGHIFPWLARALGWFPGRAVGFGGREAKTLMLDWSHNARTGRYVLRGSNRDWEAAAREQSRPVLAITIEGDDWAPQAAMEHLTSKMPQAPVEHCTVPLPAPHERGMPHFRWARRPQTVVDVIEDWVHRRILHTPPT